MIVNDEFVILRNRKYGDTSKLVTAYGKSCGKVALMAKGARKPKSKFSGLLEPTGLCFCSFYKKNGRTLHLLSKAESIGNFNNIQTGLDSLTSALTVMELVYKTQEEEDVNPDLFDCIVEFLNSIDRSDYPFAEFVGFAIDYAKILGYNLGFGADIACQEMESVYYLFDDGCFSQRNTAVNGNYFEVNGEIYSFIKKISEKLETTHSNRLSDTSVLRVFRFFEYFFGFYTEKRIRFKAPELLF